VHRRLRLEGARSPAAFPYPRWPDVTRRFGQLSPARVALLAAAAGYVVGAGYLILAILRSPSSTAAIGLLFVPFYAVVPSVVAGLLGGAGGYLWQWWRMPARRFSASTLVAATVLVAVIGIVGPCLIDKLQVALAVSRVAQMGAAELSTYFEHGSLRGDKFVLGAIAQSPFADAALLDRVAHLDDPSLHTRLESLFPLLGDNRRGFAVMRLIARHDNSGPETLRWLSWSTDDYVLGDVASNPKTPIEVLRRLAAKGGYLIEWGLARNPRTPVETLEKLADSENEYTRSGVARNPASSTEALARLEGDPVWHVRRGVAMNEAASSEQLERLANDANEQVRRAAMRDPARR
jgi:hypothetical protein